MATTRGGAVAGSSPGLGNSADPYHTSRDPKNTERRQAGDLLDALGITQESLAEATAESRAADAGIITPTVNVHGNPMNLTGPTENCSQPDYRNPVGRPEAPITKYNPMGC